MYWSKLIKIYISKLMKFYSSFIKTVIGEVKKRVHEL